MAYRFKKAEAIPAGIRRVFAEEIDWAVGQLTKSDDRAKAVHEARKSIKKVRGLLSLFSSAEDRGLRAAGRELAAARDNAVILETFDSLAARHPEINPLRHNLERATVFGGAEAAGILSDCKRRAAALPVEHLSYESLLAKAESAYRAGRKALKQARKGRDEEALHELRKKVKTHWYHVRLFEGYWDARTKQRAAALHELETLLGDEHNLTILREAIARDLETSADRNILKIIDGETRPLRERALKAAERLYAEKPRDFAENFSRLFIPRKGPASQTLKAHAALATLILTLLTVPAHSQTAAYTGSGKCQTCHPSVYARWKKTRMANVVQDPRQHPEAIIPDLSRPDLSKPDPLVTFSAADIAFVYGSKWKQRYFKKEGGDYYPLPAQWDVENQVWRPYFVKDGTDWWTAHYPADNAKRPTGPLCDGCHSVNYNIADKSVTEWNVGCERCHGPGSEHVAHPAITNIANPARLNPVQANDVCIQCHSQGRPLTNPIGGAYYDWPVGFHTGKNLADYWTLEEHKLGQTTFTHFADGTAHKNRMQGNDFVQSLMYSRGVRCASCHDVHGTENNADLIKPANVICFECHGVASPSGPRGASIEAHTHHKEGGAGSDCVACHMPKIAQTIANVNVRSHTFKFIAPSESEAYAIPNPCNGCHKDKPASWAKDRLKTWSNFSPWRVAQ